MKANIFLFFFLAGFLSCNTPNQGKVERTEISLDTISVVPKWENKEVINLELIKTKTIERNGVSQTGSSTSDIELVITKNDNNTYSGKWSIKGVKLPSMGNILEKKLESLVDGFVYNFTIDSTGIITELVNWKEIQEKGNQTLEILINEIKNQPTMNPQIIEQIKMTVGEMFNTKEKIETYLMQEVQLYFALGSIELAKDDTIVGLAYISHPLTGDIIEQHIKTVYQKAYSDSSCDVQLTQTINEADLYNAVKNTVEKVTSGENTDEFHNQMSNVEFDVKITSDYNISLSSGLVEKVTSQKEITVGSDHRIDKTEIVRK